MGQSGKRKKKGKARSAQTFRPRLGLSLTQEEMDAIHADNLTPRQEELLRSLGERYPFLRASTTEAMLDGFMNYSGR